jgi:hypothetical protein
LRAFFCSQTALAIAHANDWYPEQQLARLVMASPTILQVEWVRWALLAVLTLLLWGVADYFFYRRSTSTNQNAIPTAGPIEQ